MPDLNRVKEIDCEFRKRLAPNGSQDHWWQYKGEFLSNTARSARNLIEVYKTVGEPQFQKVTTVENILEMMSISDIEKMDYLHVFGGVVPVRGALTMARIYKHLGENGKAAEFASAGLKVMGRATALKSELESLANEI